MNRADLLTIAVALIFVAGFLIASHVLPGGVFAGP